VHCFIYFYQLLMALTESTMLPLGTLAPGFTLFDTISGQNLSLSDIRGEKGTLVMFTCNHCPYVIHVNPELVKLAKDYQPKGIGFVAISSNDAKKYPQDGPEAMQQLAREVGYPFPYLYDATQKVARTYDAACTPDFYLFDAGLRLAYRGRLDDSRPRVAHPAPLTGKDIRAALNALLAGLPIPEPQYPSMGCNIKWKAS
jgi:thiol-disulfide isomerase/thioredoxin